MKRFIFLVIICSMAMLVMTGCDSAKNPSNVAPKAINVNPVDYGNGVYYFPGVKAGFASTLSEFIASNPNLEVVSMAGKSSQGYDVGYFVVFKKK